MHSLSKYACEATIWGLYCEHWVGGLSSDGNLEWSATASEFLDDKKSTFQELHASYNSSTTCQQQDERSREAHHSSSLDVYHCGLLSDGVLSVWRHLKKKKDKLWDLSEIAQFSEKSYMSWSSQWQTRNAQKWVTTEQCSKLEQRRLWNIYPLHWRIPDAFFWNSNGDIKIISE